MNLVASPVREGTARKFALVVAIGASCVGLVFFSAYFLRDDAIAAWAGWRMKTNTALSVTLLGTSLLLNLRGLYRFSSALALLVTAIGLVTLFQYLSGISVGLDQLLATEPFSENAAHPNRMSPNASVGLICIGLALLSLRHDEAVARAGQALALFVLAIGVLAVIGYLYNASFLYQPTSYVRISPYTAAVLSMVSIAVLGLRSDVGLTRFFLSRGQGGYLARRLVIVGVVAPIFFGWMWLKLEEHYSVPPAAATALFVLSVIVSFLVLIVVLSRSIDISDTRRQIIEDDLRTSAELTAALARAATIQEVSDVVMEIGLPALGAQAGSLSLLSSDGKRLIITGTRGYSPEDTAKFNEMPVETPLPITDALRSKQAIYIASPAELESRYPATVSGRARNYGSWMAVPLEGRGRTIGVLGLSFKLSAPQAPERTEKLMSLAWHSGQALDRALLFDAENTALQRAALAQRELREASERLHAALEAAAIGTYFWDLKSGAVEHDPGVKTIFGFSADDGETIGEYSERVHDADRARWNAALERSAQHGEDFEMRYRVVLPDSSVRWVLDKGYVLRDEHGAPQQLSGAIVDFTAEQHAKTEAEAANRAKDEFLAMLGHELRNPLAPIVISLQLMKLRGEHVFERERAVISRQVEHMARLVDDLLDVSRITRGKVDLKLNPTELSVVVAKSIELVGPLLEQHGHELTVDVPPAGLVVNADEGRLTQVLTNLLTNAAKYTPDGGKIQLSAVRTDGHALLKVKDNGSGISAELLPRVFQLFVQGERTIERSAGGLGLGLAIVKTLVEHHGGRVSAYSEGTGRGTELRVELPLAVVEPTADLPVLVDTVPADSAPTKRRILVVDDNRDAASSLAELLSLEGHAVVVAYDGPAALARAEEATPEVAFLDIGLPEMDGYELARRLRDRFGEKITLVAVTGYGQDSDRRRSKEAGFDEHLVKPIDIDRTLKLAIRSL